MNMPLYYKETMMHARGNRFWATAYFLTLLIPLMIIFARVGFEICAGLVGLMFLIHSAREKQWEWLRDPLSIVCLIIWAWMVLVVQPLAVSPSARWAEAIAWIRFPLMFMALRYWVLAVPAARNLLASYIAVLLSLVALDTLWQLVTHMSLTQTPRMENGRLTGPFTTPKVGAYMGKLALPALAVCIVTAMAAKSTRWVVACLALLAVITPTILLAGERSAFLMTAFAIAIIGGLMMLREKRLRLPGIAIAIIALGGLVALYQTSLWVQQRADHGYETITNYSQSDYGALSISAYDIGRDHMLHGGGVRGYRGLSPDLYYKGAMFRGLHPHNSFLEIFADTGVPGLLLFITMIAVLLRHAVQQFRVTRGVEALLPATAIGVLVQHFFPLIGMQSFFSNWAAIVLWFSLAIIFSAIPVRRGS